MSVKMFAPPGTGGIVHGAKSGTKYVVAADGSVTVDQRDVTDLLAAGFASQLRESASSNGLQPTQLNLFHMHNSDGSAIAAAPAAGKFGISLTAGTSSALLSETANNATKTDIVYDEFVLPSSYVAAQDITCTVNAKITIGSGTLSVKTLALAAYKIANDGTHGANLVATAAQVMTNGGSDLAFTITGATLNPGDRIALNFTMVQTETATQNVSSKINSIRLS